MIRASGTRSGRRGVRGEIAVVGGAIAMVATLLGVSGLAGPTRTPLLLDSLVRQD